jgi:hypothetical protein
MVKKNKRNNFFLFEKEDKILGYMGGLGSLILQQLFPGNCGRTS